MVSNMNSLNTTDKVVGPRGVSGIGIGVGSVGVGIGVLYHES